MRAFLDDLLSDFRFADALDIAIIAILIYGVIAWFRDRAARSLMMVAAAAGLLYLLARWLEMYLTAMLFEVGFLVVVVTFVVIFQQDIRRGCERLAAATFLSRTPDVSPTNQAVETLAESVAHLAEQRTGALLIFPGREPLQRHLRGGVELDAKISFPLVCGIFNPQSPGHDGAVLIHGERVERLGVHLPLSNNLEEVGVGGTRHTAALGLAERSDALVVAVSEERGTITMAEDGRLTLVEPSALSERLQQWYRDHSITLTGVRRHPLRDMGLKFVALVAACLLWLGFAFETETVQRTLVVPIEYRNLPQDWYVDEPRTTRAELTLTGTEQAFHMLEPAAVSVSLDLSDVEADEPVVLATDRSVQNIPTELTVNRIEPPYVEVTVRQVSGDQETD